MNSHLPTPLISVVMPAYNAEKYIAEAVESILNQTYKNFELIVANHSSEDRTKEVVEGFSDPRIKLFDVPRNTKGPSAPLNVGLKKARGKYIAILDSDDVALPHRLEKQLSFMEENEDYVLVSAQNFAVSASGKVKKDIYTRVFRKLTTFLFVAANTQKKKHFLYCFFCTTVHSTVMYKKSTLGKSGYYDEALAAAVDYDLFSRMIKCGKYHIFLEPMAKYRQHKKNISKVWQDAQRINGDAIAHNAIEELLGISLNKESFIHFKNLWQPVFNQPLPSEEDSENIHILFEAAKKDPEIKAIFRAILFRGLVVCILALLHNLITARGNILKQRFRSTCLIMRCMCKTVL